MTHLLRRTSGAIALTAALLLTGCTGGEPADPAAQPAADGSGHDVGVQLFQWTWDAIAAECTDQLGPAGYAWVLTSPPNEHITGEAWWTSYQPVSYRLESRLGTREQFAAMVRTCHAAGVDVRVDAVLNHMTGQDEPGTGWAGSSYEHDSYPGLWTPADFHRCGLTPSDDIASYADRAQVQTCELLNLADLDTGAPHVRARLTAYLQDLVSLGVDGFRIDAAKHMAAQDVGAILEPLPDDVAVMQEVIRGTAEPVQPDEYVPHGQVYEFTYGKEMLGVVAGSPGLALELGTATARYLPSDDAVAFVENHDTERNGSTLSYRDGTDDALATVLLLAGTYGTPQVYSGYAFDDVDAGPPQDATGRVQDATCGTAPGPGASLAPGDWVCQHRWPQVAGMVGWRGVVGDAPVVDAWSQGDAVALGRGERGFVVVNLGDAELRVTLPTSLPDGGYCDVLTAGGTCMQSTVRDGAVSVVVPPGAAQAWDVAHRA
ncbi:alpha-amylase [Cellulomonas gilvus]|uniref:Alpha-amylase n=1 Tax=Cellulomonas gilvus (strain ATCC 13127 / NRRL B-14078) TaxID=593907 RepID=F8A2C5_CELGA|nr:alpha-amylase family protein [Cellulomonas gilvus]AEI11782.1 Alpha-amylase [Cellulomonas gilvus ATCC 13127]